ncbi:MAG: saccharopine dehydrogenase NADP-binding domain-containing protein [Planctomycetes bacterium]|nr:saccharopine dehydrogenase NADP-binding domain-containing protein [Planctomycetota bacterium]
MTSKMSDSNDPSILVLGAGMQGAACAWDLVHREKLEVTLADQEPAALARAARAIGSDRLKTAVADVSDEASLGKLLGEHTGVVSAVPYFWNERLASLAVAHGCHFTDMGGNTDIVLRELQLHERCLKRGISLVPDMGLAPGMANLLAVFGMESMDRVHAVHVRVGGLPVDPEPPLGYALLFSMHGLINEYMGDAIVLRDGEVTTEPCFSDVETLEVEGLGTLEAFPTLGGISTLPYTYRGEVETMDYRTLRYPGHFDRMKCMIELGLLDATPVSVNGVDVVPRDVFAACAGPRLTREHVEDVTVVRVEVKGERHGVPSTHVQTLVEFADEHTGHTAMMRTTAYPVAIVAAMQARGEIPPGALPPEKAVPRETFRNRLLERGFRIH